MSKTKTGLSIGAALAVVGGLMAKFAIYYWLGIAGYLLLVFGIVLIMTFTNHQ